MSILRSSACALGALLLPGLVAAEEPAPVSTFSPSEEPASVPTPSPAELEALARGLAADAATAPPQPTAPPSRGGGGDAGLPDIALILDVAGAYFSDAEPDWRGGHDPASTGFHLQQLEMSLGSNVDPFFRFDGNLVFSLFGVEIEEAYATSLALPLGLQARAGQFLTRMGRLNPTHQHAWSFVDQPLVNGKFFGSEGSRGLGAELSWLAPLPWYAQLSSSVTGAAGDCCARSWYGADDPGVDGPEDLLVTSRLEQFLPLSEDLGLLWGVSAQHGPNATGQGNRSELYASDLYLRYRPVDDPDRRSISLQLEGMYRTRQLPDDVLQDHGGYAMVVWAFAKEWSTGARQEWVTGAYGDPVDPEWTGTRERSSLQLTYTPSHFSRLRLQGARDVVEGRASPVWAAFLALELVAGSHGAHGY